MNADMPAVGRPHSKSLNGTQNVNPNFPPPKTDKPRPHVCNTCGRSFARLEHLKRHERSHTKEKPFECPECTRCFARRDLLLRHQQKLHMTTTPSSRPRNSGRRESTSSSAAVSTGRVRKNSTVNNAAGISNGGGAMRPRANTISHVDNATLGMIAAANSSIVSHGATNIGHGHHSSLNGFPGPKGYEFRGMSTATSHHGTPHGLPKLDTQGLNIDASGSLRTAPAFGRFGTDFDVDSMIFGPGSTINPAQLHCSDSPQSLAFAPPASPYHQGFLSMPQAQAMMDEDGNFEWMSGFENQMSFNTANEHAIGGSSPSAISTGSPSGISEVMLDGSNNAAHSSTPWQNSIMSQAPADTIYSAGVSGSTYPDLFPTGTLSPQSLQEQLAGTDQYYFAPPSLNSQSPLSSMHDIPNQYFHPPMISNVDTPTTSAASISSSNRHSSITSISADSITEATRQALLSNLSQPSVFSHNQRQFSQPVISSSLSPGFSTKPRSFSGAVLPSTYDLQRYVTAYIQYFHPHLPFLHVPSLSFDSPVYTNNIHISSTHQSFGQSGIAGGGGGCLILAMAAIGALYEFDGAASKDLFEMAKKMIQLYLEERRKADLSATLGGSPNTSENLVQNTPLWLVQAMLLNVIYGHNCGDKTSADIASTHCAALVSLARAAELSTCSQDGPSLKDEFGRWPKTSHLGEDIQMADTGWNMTASADVPGEQLEWIIWKISEERKRTLYAVYILSSMLVSAYNHTPALTNSEIQLDLPCDEDLWAAESPEAWYALGAAAAAEQKATPFPVALCFLLTAGQRHQQQQHHSSQSYHLPFDVGLNNIDPAHNEVKPSTFGCLVLINALHNYIWETRQRHFGRQWTTLENESMHARIEPALKAWHAAWASNPQHSLERPNPFGVGPLSADCMPLLHLAYVRLFVNLGRSKEAFWQRDFDGMADELARGSEITQHAEDSPSSSNSDSTSFTTSTSGSSPALDGNFVKVEQPIVSSASHFGVSSGQSSKRERHLRKAAFYAADSLAMSDNLGVTFADLDSRELPIQSALCAFDCSQVLAEWVSTVQERVGKYLGILGKDNIDFGQVPGIMLLEDEDCKLLDKINHILSSAEVKITVNDGLVGSTTTLPSASGLSSVKDCGYGSKILMVTAYMLDKAAVWPGELPTLVMFFKNILIIRY